MAGANFPIGSVSGTRLDLSPWLESMQTELQRQLQNRSQDMQGQQFDRSMDMREADQAFGQKVSLDEMALKTREFEHRKGIDIENMIARENDAKAQQQVLGDDLAFRKQQADSQVALDADKLKMRDKELGAKQDAEAAGKVEDENQAALYTKARGIIAQRAPAMDISGQGTPEMVRDSLLAEIETVDVSGKEKLALQKAVDDWYGQRVQQKREERLTEKEQREAEKDKADIEIKHEMLDQAKENKKRENAVKASAPMRKRQESIQRSLTDLATKAAMIEGLIQGATDENVAARYRNALTGFKSAAEQLKAEYDRLEAQASAREAEILAKG